MALVVGLALGTLDFTPGPQSTIYLILLGVTAQSLGYLFISISLPRLPAVVTSIILLAQPVLAVLFAMALINERPSAYQLVGVAMVVAGIALATIPLAALRRSGVEVGRLLSREDQAVAVRGAQRQRAGVVDRVLDRLGAEDDQHVVLDLAGRSGTRHPGQGDRPEGDRVARDGVGAAARVAAGLTLTVPSSLKTSVASTPSGMLTAAPSGPPLITELRSQVVPVNAWSDAVLAAIVITVDSAGKGQSVAGEHVSRVGVEERREPLILGHERLLAAPSGSSPGCLPTLVAVDGVGAVHRVAAGARRQLAVLEDEHHLGIRGEGVNRRRPR